MKTFAGAYPIEVHELTHRYAGADHPAIDGLSFQVAPGEIMGLLGANGAGKTTTLHIVLGLLKPTGGTLRVFGFSPVGDRIKILPRVNFASVGADLPGNLRVDECLRIFAALYGVSDSRKRIGEAVERFELGPFVRQRIGSLSSGEQMRLKICKALLNDPELLVLDEPTLSLDPYMAHKVRSILKAVQRERKMAILHTSHNMREVESFCDRILFLHRGKRLADGSPQEVLTQFKSRSLDELFIRVSESGEIYHVE